LNPKESIQVAPKGKTSMTTLPYPGIERHRFSMMNEVSAQRTVDFELAGLP
jgi:hypothetical protein